MWLGSPVPLLKAATNSLFELGESSLKIVQRLDRIGARRGECGLRISEFDNVTNANSIAVFSESEAVFCVFYRCPQL
jgi:hypothetical protein